MNNMNRLVVALASVRHARSGMGNDSSLNTYVFGSAYTGTCIAIFSVAIGLLGPGLEVKGAEADWRPVPGRIMTRWAKDVNPQAPLPEYPRPQLQRDEWKNLNGLWDYATVTNRPAGGVAPMPDKWTGRILVPFAIESALSGVKQSFRPESQLWYHRTFDAPVLSDGKRLLLHFGAVDWEAKVTVNGKPVGEHRGGYDAFTCDITDVVKPGSSNELVVSVIDETGGTEASVTQVRGKQNLNSTARNRSIRYTPCSGIWQTVWMETVPAAWIRDLKLIPDVDAGVLRLTVSAAGKIEAGIKVEAVAYEGDKEVGRITGEAGSELALPITKPRLWSPGDPFLYDLKVTWGADRVTSYFGMRKISLGKDEKGVVRPLLNGKFVFQAGLLDQGYWPDGIYTAPTDEALKYDIEMTRKLGFNMARKHIKVEPDRWYYWADKLGVLVWQDMVCGKAGRGAIKDPKTQKWSDGTRVSDASNAQFEAELKAMVEQHWNHPSIIVWVLFNEGWGQYEVPRLTKWVRALDSSRLINSTCGGPDIPPNGDFIDVHAYAGPAFPPREPTRISALGEFGGIGCAVSNHTWGSVAWGYRKVADPATLTTTVVELWRKTWQLKDLEGLSAAVYTQTTDVEAECNGMLTYDREVVKVDLQQVSEAVQGKFKPLPEALPQPPAPRP